MLPARMGPLGFCWAMRNREENEKISSEESLYSYENILLPALGGRSMNNLHRKKFIITPFDEWYRWWCIFLVVLVVYCAWAAPFELGFMPRPPLWSIIANNVVNVFFAVDIVLTFFVAYIDKTTFFLEDDHKKIAGRYLKTAFFADVISTAPYELFQKKNHNWGCVYGILQLLRLWRLRRVSNLFAKLEKDPRCNYFWIRCFKILCVTIFAVHCGACAMFLLAWRNPNPHNTWIAIAFPNFREMSIWACYVCSLYWSVTTMTTTGYGDLHGTNIAEMGFLVGFDIFSIGLNSYVIGNITNLIVHGTRRTFNFRETENAAVDFCNRNRLPPRLKHQVLSHMRLKYRSEGLQQRIMSYLPKATRSMIAQHLFYHVVEKVYLFQGVSTDFLMQLVAEMEAEYVPPREAVLLQNQESSELYIVASGSVDLFLQLDGSEKHIQLCGPGEIVGEIGMLLNQPEPLSVRTHKISQLLRLRKHDFNNTVQSHPSDGRIVIANLIQRVKEIKARTTEQLSLELSLTCPQAVFDFPLSLSSLAARANASVMEQLLIKGFNPDDVDRDGRTPLHVASSRGFIDCVQVLLNYGSDPNCKDGEGNVPLWHAVVAKHKDVAEMLWRHGARLNAENVGKYLCTSVQKGDLDVVKDLIHYGANVNALSEGGVTALHMAILQKNTDLIALLLDSGANAVLAERNGQTPYNLAENLGDEGIILMLNNMPRKPFSRRTRPSKLEDNSPRSPESPSASCRCRFHLSSNPGSEAGAECIYESNSSHESSFSNSLRQQNVKNSAPENLDHISLELPSNQGSSLASSLRVTIHEWHPQLQEPRSLSFKKIILLPNTFQDLLEIAEKAFQRKFSKVLSEDGAIIDDIRVIRDNDHLYFVEDERQAAMHQDSL